MAPLVTSRVDDGPSKKLDGPLHAAASDTHYLVESFEIDEQGDRNDDRVEGGVNESPDNPETGQDSDGQDLSFSSFDQFFKSQFRPIVAHTMMHGATFEEARDATQTAMIEVAKRWATTQYPRAYARKVAALSFIASNVNEKKLQDALLSTSRLVSIETDPIGALIEMERITAAVETLPPKQRQLIAAALSGMTATEIATAHGMNPDTVRSNLRHARKTLRERLFSNPTDATDTPSRTGRQP
ncbi:sigma-70 family RNA polymerase sigma factor [Micromonospora tulbaghiae]|uniref:sigma-70 family RNA polymerase sigma factor n=1 Tax=Micromonospora tulbaghiae TaxID=479978 RepID=UPI0033EF13B3